MKVTAIVEKCASTGQYVGYITVVAGAQSQAASIDRLLDNLKAVVDPLQLESEFVGLQTLEV